MAETCKHCSANLGQQGSVVATYHFGDYELDEKAHVREGVLCADNGSRLNKAYLAEVMCNTCTADLGPERNHATTDLF